MKTRDIQRGISSRRSSVGRDGPNLGRVSRLRDSEMTGADLRVSRRRTDGNPSRRRSLLIWSALLSVVTLTVIGLAVTFWLLPYLSRNSAPVAGTLFNYDAHVRVASKFPSPSREKALEMVKRAIANRDPELLDTLFRMGTSSRAEILAFLSASEQRDGFIDRYEWLSSMDVNGLLLDGVLVSYKGKEKPIQRLAFLTPDTAGNWKLDFDAFARTVTPSWQDLLEKGADQALVRVMVCPDVYYNGPFGDDKQWVCYGMASVDSETLMRGYCRVGSDVSDAMGRLFLDGRKLSRATLEIRRVEGGERLQFEITKVVAEDWVVPGPPANKS
ncbi:MAG: hypothetical protein V4819_12830 [Verrucomicrobiota bacterium]